MRIPDRVASKVDEALREKLREAAPSDCLRVVARLSSPDPTGDQEPMPPPAAFPSRETWRQQLIANREASLRQRLGPVFERLRQLGVVIAAGGKLTATVVLEGTADAIVMALDLDAITHADIDRTVHIR